jgi:hypothetical protein
MSASQLLVRFLSQHDLVAALACKTTETDSCAKYQQATLPAALPVDAASLELSVANSLPLLLLTLLLLPCQGRW